MRPDADATRAVNPAKPMHSRRPASRWGVPVSFMGRFPKRAERSKSPPRISQDQPGASTMRSKLTGSRAAGVAACGQPCNCKGLSQRPRRLEAAVAIHGGFKPPLRPGETRGKPNSWMPCPFSRQGRAQGNLQVIAHHPFPLAVPEPLQSGRVRGLLHRPAKYETTSSTEDRENNTPGRMNASPAISLSSRRSALERI